eukprot:m.2209 g.2209  ORF g.2209 m.2209 type:complete len:391 (-) comp1735_c0_seq1:248-1420(-)
MESVVDEGDCGVCEKCGHHPQRVLNFSAGPGRLPEEVLIKAQQGMLNWGETGIGLMEHSHRSAHFQGIISKAEENLRNIMDIPPNYKVLFLQGGATGQFAAIPMNLASEEGAVVDYIVSGEWSSKAAKEAAKFTTVNVVNPVGPSYSAQPSWESFKFTDGAAYVYYCDNETVNGVEFSGIPNVPEGTTIVCDMSSNFLTRKVDVSKFGLVYAGAQKNAGPAGVTIVIVRDDLLGKAHRFCPTIFDYQVMAKAGSMLNTPPCWSIYVVGLVLEWVVEQGGLDEFERRSDTKSNLIYGVIDGSNGFYMSPVEKSSRSRVNIPFRVCGDDGVPSEEREKAFLVQAEEKNMVYLKGHRSVGGLRASLYNATTADHTSCLANFMREFASRFTATQ